MTRLAIWRAESLLGRELKERLAGRTDLWDDLRLLGPESDASKVSEVGEEAVLILPGTEDNLRGIDLLFYCAEPGVTADIPEGLPGTAITIVLSDGDPVDDFPPVVAGLSADIAQSIGTAATVASAHPAAVALAHLLEPLLDLGLESSQASVILPTSTRGQEGIDGLLDETRAILAFQPRATESIFASQIAFNIAPSPDTGRQIARTAREALGEDRLRITAQAWLGGVFHSLAVGAHVRLSPSVDEDAVRQAFESSPSIEFAERPETLGPIDAAGSSLLQLGLIETAADPGSFWLRAVMDNLTTGGALNAIGIAEAILAAGSTERRTM